MLAKPEIGTKEHIVLWLSSKTGPYDWVNVSVCACGQYWQENVDAERPWAWQRDGYVIDLNMDWLNCLAVHPIKEKETFERLYKDACADLYR
jgi:hypothetical protein